MTDQPEEHAGVAGLAKRVIALGREVDSLGRLVSSQRARLGTVDDALADIRGEVAAMETSVEETSGRVGALTRTVAELGDALAQLLAEEEDQPPTSWLTIEDQDKALAILDDLSAWLERVYLVYPDSKVPSCWMWHPAVVDELLWLRRAWALAWHPKRGTPSAQADWCDRYRLGVSERVTRYAQACSVEQHLPGQPAAVALPRRVGLVSAREGIAAWVAGGGLLYGTAPSPTRDHVAEAEALQ